MRFDGVQFNPAPRVLALTGLGGRVDGNATLLILNRFGGDLTSGIGALGELTGLLFDDARNSFSFTESVARCQLLTPLNESFPLTAPRFPEIVPAQRSGWLKCWEANETALLGLSLSFHPQSATAPQAFTQGRLLHKLALTNSARLLVPVSPPQ